MIENDCPWCGGAAFVCGDFLYWVKCDVCGAGGPSKDTAEEAIAAWNEVATAAKRARREALEEACAAVCRWCDEGYDLVFREYGVGYFHEMPMASDERYCHATDIRALMEEEAGDGS